MSKAPVTTRKCYRLKEGSSIDPWLKQLELVDTKTINDEYFDTHEKYYYKEQIFIRLRNGASLEIKLNPMHQADPSVNIIPSRGYVFPISFHPQQTGELVDPTQGFNTLESLIGIKRPHPFTFTHFLGCNRLRSLVTLTKTRNTYKVSSAPHISVVVDTFDELGTFIGFKPQLTALPCPTHDFLKDVQKLVRDLPLTLFNSRYVDLSLKKTNEVSYKKIGS